MSCLVSSLVIMFTLLGVLLRLRFKQGDVDEADKCMPHFVLGDPKKEMITCHLVFPGKGEAFPEVCKSCVQRSSHNVSPQISFLILFSCWDLHRAFPTVGAMVEFISMNSYHNLQFTGEDTEQSCHVHLIPKVSH